MAKFVGKTPNFDGLGALFPHFCTGEREICHGRGPSITFIGVMCHYSNWTTVSCSTLFVRCLLFGWQLYCTCLVKMSQLAGGNWSLLLRPSDAGDVQSVRHRCHHADDDSVQRQMGKNCERVVYTR